eukprot:ANDGO_05294.mRNA.1 Protein ZINC INDUCED FACILITATOR-LIKE 1
MSGRERANDEDDVSVGVEMKEIRSSPANANRDDDDEFSPFIPQSPDTDSSRDEPSASERRSPMHAENDDVKLPLLQIFVVCIILFAEGYNSSSLFPYVYFFARDLLPDVAEDHLGYYVGLLGGMFFFGQFISGRFWGMYSDRKGRKRVMILGLGCNVITMIVFGVSTNFPMAIISRFISGLMNGNVAAGKTYIADVVPDSKANRAFGLLGLVWGFSGILGPVAGGLLARPAVQYPSVFPEDGLFGRYPYLLPCLVSSGVTLVGLAIGVFVLQDSKKFKHSRGSVRYENLRDQEDAESSTLPSEEEFPASPMTPASPSKQQHKPPLKDGLVLRSVFVYMLMSFVYIISDELTPLFMVRAVDQGGLAFGSLELGIQQAFSGAGLVCYQLFAYAKLANRFGRLFMLRLGLFGAIPYFFLLPFLALFAAYRIPLWCVIILMMSTRPIFSNSSFTSIFILINNTCLPEYTGEVNGIAQAAASFARSIGPLIGGSLFAWSINSGLPFPFDIHFPFFLISILIFVDGCIAVRLPASINFPRASAASLSTAAHDADAVGHE